jgi:hypothetical protein
MTVIIDMFRPGRSKSFFFGPTACASACPRARPRGAASLGSALCVMKSAQRGSKTARIFSPSSFGRGAGAARPDPAPGGKPSQRTSFGIAPCSRSSREQGHSARAGCAYAGSVYNIRRRRAYQRRLLPKLALAEYVTSGFWK